MLPNTTFESLQDYSFPSAQAISSEHISDVTETAGYLKPWDYVNLMGETLTFPITREH